MKTFEGLLKGLPRSDHAIVEEGRATTVGQLLDRAEDVRASWGDEPPPSLAATSGSVVRFVATLLAGDGAVEQLYLLPEELADWRGGSGSRSAAAIDGTVWTLFTSGTTGEPKGIPHSLAGLTRTVKTDPEAGSEFVWGLLYDPARFAGLQVVLQALLSAGSLSVLSRIDPKSAVREIRDTGVNALSATPSLWRRLLMVKGFSDTELRQITLGGEIADDPLLSKLRAAFPQARITHIYASTEAGVGFAVKDGRAGFPVSFLTDGVHGTALRIAEDGELQIRTPGRTADSGAGEAGFIPTGDLVRVDGERVHFLGRRNGTINVGGQKVIPEEVENVLRNHPLVLEAHASGRRHSLMGEMVSARIVLDPEVDDPAEALEMVRRHCRELLARHKVPSSIEAVAEITHNVSGKLDRKAPR